MPSTSSRSRSARTRGRRHHGHRLVWIDVARGVALLSMMVAHTAPTGGPGGVLNLSEHLTAALFAALVGVSARVETERLGVGRALARALLRALALVGAAWLCGLFGAAVVDVLTHLAVVTVLMALLAALPMAAHLVLALVAGGGGVLLAGLGTPTVAGTLQPAAEAVGLPLVQLYPLVSDFLTDGPYRLTTFLAWALFGAVLVRSLHGGGARGTTTAALARSGRLTGLGWALGGLALAGVVLALTRIQTGQMPVPYSGTAAETLVNTGLVLAVLGACAAVVPGRASVATDVLAVPGSMTLSVYVAHQAFLGWVAGSAGAPWVNERGTDDTWWTLGALLIGAVLLPLLWRSLVRARPFRSGPLEGVVRLATDPLGR